MAFQKRGRASIWETMDQKIRREIDQHLMIKDMKIEEVARKYQLHRTTIMRRKRDLIDLSSHAATAKTDRARSEARSTIDWAVGASQETFDLAKNRKVARAHPSTGLNIIGEDGQPVMDHLPDLKTMIETVRNVHDIARTLAEIDGELGPKANGGLLGPGGMLNVLVMPKAPGVESGQPMRQIEAAVDAEFSEVAQSEQED